MKPLIQVQAVSQRFSTASGEFLALQNVSFDIHEGETVSLIGHSGCGKSTLLNLIAGITLPTEGGLIIIGVVGLLLEQGLMLIARRFSWQEK